MRKALINEDHSKIGTQWSVSFDGYNTDDKSQTIIVIDNDEAIKLKKVVDDLKDKIGFLCYNLKLEIEEKIENGKSGYDLILEVLEDIETIYL